MAILNEIRPEDEQGGGGAYLGGDSNTSASGEGGTIQAGSSTATPATASTGGGGPAPTKSGSYTNLMSYIGANEPNSGVMGGAVEKNINDTMVKPLEESTNTWGTNAKNAITAGTPTTNKDIVNSIGTGTTVDPGVMKNIEAGGAGYTYSGPRADEIQADYKGPMTATAGTYVGPTAAANIEGSQDVYTNLNKLSGASDLTKNAPGVSTLLKDTYAGKPYSAGENVLDTTLVGGGAGRQNLSNIQNAFGTGTTNVGNQETNIANQITAGQAAPAQVQGQYDKLIQDAIANSKATRAAYDAAINKSMATAASHTPPPPPPPPKTTPAPVTPNLTIGNSAPPTTPGQLQVGGSTGGLPPISIGNAGGGAPGQLQMGENPGGNIRISSSNNNDMGKDRIADAAIMAGIRYMGGMAHGGKVEKVPEEKKKAFFSILKQIQGDK